MADRSPSDDVAAGAPEDVSDGVSVDDPLRDARALLADAPGPDRERVARAEAALRAYGDLGPLHPLALWLAAWPGPGGASGPGADASPGLRRVRRPVVCLWCASYALDGGAAERARARLERLAAGGGAVSGMARALGAGVEVFDLAVDRPSPDPVRNPGDVMGARALAATLAFGLEAVAKSPDLLVVAVDTEGADAAAAALQSALAAEGGADPFRLLRRHGGREIAAAAGAILAARSQRTPVILDGPAPRAAAAVLRAARPDALDHVQDAHDLTDLPELGEPGAAGCAALSLVRLAGEIGAD